MRTSFVVGPTKKNIQIYIRKVMRYHDDIFYYGVGYFFFGENDKSDVEMKLPFFFYNLNTLSSHAATALTLHFISFFHPLTLIFIIYFFA
jgi:hypothetical protein